MAAKPQVSKPQPIQVEIFGQSYSVRGVQEPRRVQEAAAYVDGQMREISRAGAAVDSVRIAVLAALNIADELFRLRAGQRETEEQAERRASEDVERRALEKVEQAERQAAEKAARLARELAAALEE